LKEKRRNKMIVQSGGTEDQKKAWREFIKYRKFIKYHETAIGGKIVCLWDMVDDNNNALKAFDVAANFMYYNVSPCKGVMLIKFHIERPTYCMGFSNRARDDKFESAFVDAVEGTFLQIRQDEEWSYDMLGESLEEMGFRFEFLF
jgi:hypothetical protein